MATPSNIDNELDLAGILLHASLDVQFPRLVSYAERDEESASQVQDLLWKMATTAIADAIEVSSPTLQDHASDERLRRFIRQAMEGDFERGTFANAGWAGAYLVGSASSFWARSQVFKNGLTKKDPLQWLPALQRALLSYIARVTDDLRNSAASKKRSISKENDKRKLISALLQPEWTLEKVEAIKVIDHLCESDSSEEVVEIESNCDRIEKHFEIVADDSPDLPRCIIEFAIGSELTIKKGSRVFNISVCWDQRRVGQGFVKEEGPQKDLLEDIHKSIKGFDGNNLDSLASFLEPPFSLAGAGVVLGIVEILLTLESYGGAEDLRSRLDAWQELLSNTIMKRSESAELSLRLVRHSAFIHGLGRRFSRPGRASVEWRKLEKGSLDPNTLLARARRLGLSKNPERREVLDEFHKRWIDAHLGVELDVRRFYEISERAHRLGLPEIAIMAQTLATALIDYAGAGPALDTADRGAVLYDPLVVTSLRHKTWSVLSWFEGRVERNKTFLSYRRADSFSLVDRIVTPGTATPKDLDRAQAWVDFEEIRAERFENEVSSAGSKDWRLSILAATQDCGSFILFLSPGYFRSRACVDEMRSTALAMSSRSVRVAWLAVDGAAIGDQEQSFVRRNYGSDPIRNLVRCWAALGELGVDDWVLKRILEAEPLVRYVVSPFVESDVKLTAERVCEWRQYGWTGFYGN